MSHNKYLNQQTDNRHAQMRKLISQSCFTRKLKKTVDNRQIVKHEYPVITDHWMFCFDSKSFEQINISGSKSHLNLFTGKFISAVNHLFLLSSCNIYPIFSVVCNSPKQLFKSPRMATNLKFLQEKERKRPLFHLATWQN